MAISPIQSAPAQSRWAKRAKQVGLGLVIGVPAALLLVLSGPALISGGWHLVHGNHVEYAGLAIPVPRGWFSYRSARTRCLGKLSAGLNPDLTSATFQLLPNNSQLSPQEMYARWKADGVIEHRTLGHTVTATRTIQVAGKEAFCIEWGEPNAPKYAIGCATERMAVFFYYSDPSAAGEFYGILNGIRVAPHGNGIVPDTLPRGKMPG